MPRKKKVEELDEEVTVKKPTTIDELPGIGVKTVSKLHEAGLRDLMSIATTSPAILMDIAELSKPVAQKAISAARKAVEMGFKTGSDILERRGLLGKIKTGSEELDKLFGGGIETQGITECFGEFGSGKSQIGFQLSVMVQLPVEQGGLGGKAVFVDTEGTFRPERIKQIAEANGLNTEEVLKNIFVARAYSSDHQMLLVEKVDELIKKEGEPIKIVIVDSMMALFRAEYAGRGTLADRQQKINKHMHFMQKLADEYNIVIYVTNQVMSRPDVFFGNPTAAIGGHIVGHNSTYRVYLRKSRKDKRIARMVDSPHLPDGEAVFRVTEKGIVDSE